MAHLYVLAPRGRIAVAENRQPLAGKVAVVSGGSNGIGAAAVRLLAEAGARVVVGYHGGEERARALAAALPGDGHAVIRLALEDSATLDAAAGEIGARF